MRYRCQSRHSIYSRFAAIYIPERVSVILFRQFTTYNRHLHRTAQRQSRNSDASPYRHGGTATKGRYVCLMLVS